MSNQGNPPDEPTRAYTPVDGDDYSTRLERPIEPYGEGGRGDVPPTPYPTEYDERPGLVAPLIAVGLLCMLIGIGLGYLLFHDTSSGEPVTTTTTTAVPAPTTTTSETTTSTSSTTTTSSTSTTAKPTSTTKATTTSTTKATSTTGSSQATTSSSTTTP